MRRPGVRLRQVLSRYCDEKTLRQRVDPAIADLQSEHRDAARQGRTCFAHWVWLTGHLALAKVVAVCLWEALIVLPRHVRRHWTHDDQAALRRIGGWVVPVLIVVTILLNVPFWRFVRTDGDSSWLLLFLYLVPHALTLALPVAFMTAIGLALPPGVPHRLRAAVISIAAVCSFASLVNVGWITPASNQAFRVAVAADPTLAKGSNELTLLEARSRLSPGRDDPLGRVRAATGYYQRWALSSAPLVLTVFALSLRTRYRPRRALMILTSGVAFLAYYLPGAGDVVDRLAWMPAVLIAWLPILLFSLAALANRLTTRLVTLHALVR